MKHLLWSALLLLCACTVSAAPLYFVETEVDTATPWVQAQVTLRLSFFHAAAVSDVKLTAPQARLADIQPIGATSRHEAERGGQRYRVHEQLFAILPFASGRVELTGAGASGRLPGSAQPTDWTAPDIALEVRPAAPGVVHWLPAAELRLSQSWSAANPAIGQPLLRTLRIEATGILPAQLPDLHFDIAGASVLALPSRTKTPDSSAGKLTVIREQDFEILPTLAGTLVVPPLHVSWWKVGAGETALATLPGRNFVIPEADRGSAPVAAETGTWPHLALLCGALVVSGFLVWRYRSRWYSWRLRRACQRGDARAALAWGRKCWPADAPTNLIMLAGCCPAGTARLVLQLDARRYGRRSSEAPRSAGFVAADNSGRQSALP